MNLQHPVLRHMYLIARKEDISAMEYDNAVAAAKTFVGATFTELSSQYKQIVDVSRIDKLAPITMLTEPVPTFRSNIVAIMHMIDGMIVGRDAAHADLRHRIAPNEMQTRKPRATRFPPRVFVVHGHDHAALTAVVEHLRSLGFEVCVLKDEPNRGRTIIEKFEEESDGVDYAVVLCTPDDEGYSVSSGSSTVRRRARQNVVLELGYFIAELDRSRVCALMVDDVEMPSDVTGVLYTRFDATGTWIKELNRELEAAGLFLALGRKAAS